MKYRPDAFEQEDNPDLCKVVRVRTPSGQMAHMVKCQLLEEDGTMSKKAKPHPSRKGHYELEG